ncbi:hypothetical protein Q0F98_40355 [Paenibacillus amylolyticus]|nr:hypothetical protein Q0F98_40355 [Paenibacillus amylolyticus]
MSTYDLKSIRLQVIEAGEDKVFLVTGGKAHIGAVATFYVDHERAKGRRYIFLGIRNKSCVSDLPERLPCS